MTDFFGTLDKDQFFNEYFYSIRYGVLCTDSKIRLIILKEVLTPFYFYQRNRAQIHATFIIASHTAGCFRAKHYYRTGFQGTFGFEIQTALAEVKGPCSRKRFQAIIKCCSIKLRPFNSGITIMPFILPFFGVFSHLITVKKSTLQDDGIKITIPPAGQIHLNTKIWQQICQNSKSLKFNCIFKFLKPLPEHVIPIFVSISTFDWVNCRSTCPKMLE